MSERMQGTIPSHKGKSMKEFFGEDRAIEIKQKISMKEFFGEDRAIEIKQKIRDTIQKNGGRSGNNNGFFGHKHTEEYKQKARDRQLGVYRGKQNIPFSIDGVVYQSLGEASKKLSLPVTTIRWRIKSTNPKFNEYKYLKEVE